VNGVNLLRLKAMRSAVAERMKPSDGLPTGVKSTPKLASRDYQRPEKILTSPSVIKSPNLDS